MKYKSYSEKLKDPRWQKKRLEIMHRDSFTCRECWATEKTLNVHHAYYQKGRNPWEYPSESLTTLCEECHAEREATMLHVLKKLSLFSNQSLMNLNGTLLFLHSDFIDTLTRGISDAQKYAYDNPLRKETTCHKDS